MKILLLLLLSVACRAGAISPIKWFPLNWGGGGLYIDCEAPESMVANNGLTINILHATKSCTNSSSSILGSSQYTSGILQANTFNFTYGHIAFRAAFPTSTTSGTQAAIWLLGTVGGSSNCQVLYKTIIPTTADCLPAPTGYTEIDLAEILGSTTAVNQQIHIPGHNDGCTAGGFTNTDLHDYEVDWHVGVIHWYVDGNLTCSVAQSYVPSTPMFPIIQTAVGGSPNPASYPSALQAPYFRICPVAIPIGSCTQPNATIFDEEFSGTATPDDIYVAQTYTGDQTGQNCANAFGIVNYVAQQPQWVNDPGYWTGGFIVPGTRIHLCGNITTQIIAQGSGTPTQTISFILEPGASLSNRINGNGQTNILYSPASIAPGSTLGGAASLHGSATIK